MSSFFFFFFSSLFFSILYNFVSCISSYTYPTIDALPFYHSLSSPNSLHHFLLLAPKFSTIWCLLLVVSHLIKPLEPLSFYPFFLFSFFFDFHFHYLFYHIYLFLLLHMESMR